MEIQRSDLEKIYDAINEATEFFKRRDEMNAKIHLAEEIRYSPITSRLINERMRLEVLLDIE